VGCYIEKIETKQKLEMYRGAFLNHTIYLTEDIERN
jgi:hypothetical protein